MVIKKTYPRVAQRRRLAAYMLMRSRRARGRRCSRRRRPLKYACQRCSRVDQRHYSGVCIGAILGGRRALCRLAVLRLLGTSLGWLAAAGLKLTDGHLRGPGASHEARECRRRARGAHLVTANKARGDEKLFVFVQCERTRDWFEIGAWLEIASTQRPIPVTHYRGN